MYKNYIGIFKKNNNNENDKIHNKITKTLIKIKTGNKKRKKIILETIIA